MSKPKSLVTDKNKRQESKPRQVEARKVNSLLFLSVSIFTLLTVIAYLDRRALFYDNSGHFYHLFHHGRLQLVGGFLRHFETLQQLPSLVLFGIFEKNIPLRAYLYVLEASYMFLPILSFALCYLIHDKRTLASLTISISGIILSLIFVFAFSGSYSMQAVCVFWPTFLLALKEKPGKFSRYCILPMLVLLAITYEQVVLLFFPLSFIFLKKYNSSSGQSKAFNFIHLIFSLFSIIYISSFIFKHHGDAQFAVSQLNAIAPYIKYFLLFPFFSLFIPAISSRFFNTKTAQVINKSLLFCTFSFLIMYHLFHFIGPTSPLFYFSFRLFPIFITFIFSLLLLFPKQVSRIYKPNLLLTALVWGSLSAMLLLCNLERKNRIAWNELNSNISHLNQYNRCSVLRKETVYEWIEFGLNEVFIPKQSILLQGSWSPKAVIFVPDDNMNSSEICKPRTVQYPDGGADTIIGPDYFEKHYVRDSTIRNEPGHFNLKFLFEF